jgi:hypothetical protein
MGALRSIGGLNYIARSGPGIYIMPYCKPDDMKTRDQ